MNFARFEELEVMKRAVPLTAVNGKSEIRRSGLPMAYDDEYIYMDSRQSHSLVIGTTGSGKTQVITLPMLELSRMAGESVVVHDTKSELYDATKDKFKDSGYEVIKLNFDDAINTNCWNPFELPQRLYKEGNKDKSQELVEDLGYYLLNDLEDSEASDPFWINSAIDYFTGITLYAFENEDAVNFDTIFDVDTKVKNDKNFIDSLNKRSNIYINLRGILEAPPETKGSIISVFNQKMKRYISKENLRRMTSRTEFDMAGIATKKTIIYVVSGNSNNSEHLLPLLISQVYYAKDCYSTGAGKINIIIDDFFTLYPIRSFAKMLNHSRGIYINFTIMIRGFNDLKNIYGVEDTETIKMCFANIVYLLSQDIKTLEEISYLCGNQAVNTPLISVEELKTMKFFEAIILTPRIMPFKTKLLPYYEIEKNL